MPTTGYEHYSAFRDQQRRLLDVLRESGPILDALSLRGLHDTASKLTDRVASDHFKVMILGEFKRGKSTFINALLRAEILPAFATPCTAVINEVKWSESKRAVLHFANPLPENIPDSLPDKAIRHIRSRSNGQVPPMEIAVEELEQYVVIPDPAKDQRDSVAETPYARVELFWPLDICRNGVEIIDSPGLNEHTTRTRVTTGYLDKVDAVIFVMSCQALASQSEMQVIERDIRGNGHEDVFIVCNRFDEVRERDRDRLVRFARDKMSSKTSFGSDGIHFISALDALEGRLGNDASRVSRSGILPLEAALARFLVQDRGRVKLLQPARELTLLLKKARQEIPRQRKMLEADLSALEQRYEEKKPLLDDAERRRQQILARIETCCLRLKDDVRRATVVQIRSVAQQLPEMLKAYQPKSDVEFFGVFKGKGGLVRQGEDLAKELVEYLAGQIEDAQVKWRKAELEPLIQAALSQMAEDLKVSVQELLSQIDQIKADLAGIEPPGAGEEEPKPWERILSAAGGFIVGGVGSALVGGTMGFKEMLKSLAPNFALAVGMIVLGITNPFILIPALLGAGLLQGVLKAGKATETIKAKVASELARKLADDAPGVAENVATSIYEQAAKFKSMTSEGLEKEIGVVREQVEAVLAEKRRGETAVREKKLRLEELDASLGRIDSGLADMVFAIAGENG